MTTKRRLLFSAPFEFLPAELLASLEDVFEVAYVYGKPLDAQLDSLEGAHAWLVSTAPERFLGRDVLTRGLILEVVATPSTGWTHLDREYLDQKGISLLSLRGSRGVEDIRASSEFTFALILALLRKLPVALGEARAGRWRGNEAVMRGNELCGKTLGVVGYGRIGRNLCRYARAFDVECLAHDPYVNVVDEWVEAVELAVLLRRADIVCLCMHLSPKTSGAFGREQFQSMKRGAWFINTARGELIDDVALLHALEADHLAGAAVDVLAGEQSLAAEGNVLLRWAAGHQNLIVTPHVAGLAVEAETKAAEEIVGQLVDYYEHCAT